MQIRSGNGTTFSHPEDRSLKAYKAWMTEIAKRLTTGKKALKLTEAEWIENWKDFWKQTPKH